MFTAWRLFLYSLAPSERNGFAGSSIVTLIGIALKERRHCVRALSYKLLAPLERKRIPLVS